MDFIYALGIPLAIFLLKTLKKAKAGRRLGITKKNEVFLYLFLFLVSFVLVTFFPKELDQFLSSFTAGNQQSTSETKQQISQNTTVTRVIDGDTVEIQGGAKVRYIGIDTPESVKPNTPIQCFAKEASEKNKELVLGKEVRLEKDVSETDKYGRLLRYVYVGDTMINEVLVKEGYAHAVSYPPDVKYQEKLRFAEQFARENNKGLWNSCNQESTFNSQPINAVFQSPIIEAGSSAKKRILGNV